MRLKSVVLFLVLGFLAACDVPPAGTEGQKIYWIPKGQTAAVQFRILDSVNALRAAVGAPAVSFSAELNAAAATHARDISIQNRPWHFGSDGSSPIDRATRAGYPGVFLGETLSETYESELETLAAWMKQDDTRGVLLDERARFIGVAWFQESSGKLWWVVNLGA